MHATAPALATEHIHNNFANQSMHAPHQILPSLLPYFSPYTIPHNNLYRGVMASVTSAACMQCPLCMNYLDWPLKTSACSHTSTFFYPTGLIVTLATEFPKPIAAFFPTLVSFFFSVLFSSQSSSSSAQYPSSLLCTTWLQSFYPSLATNNLVITHAGSQQFRGILSLLPPKSCL